MVIWIILFIALCVVMFVIYFMGYLGGVPYALKVFYDEKYDHYKTYKAGHYKTVRENKDLFKKDWFQELCFFFQ